MERGIDMKINVTMLTFAVLIAVCFSLTGVAIAMRSIVGILLTLVAAVILFGLGFKTKKKLREAGKL